MTAARLQGRWFLRLYCVLFEFGHAVLPDKLSYYATVVANNIIIKLFSEKFKGFSDGMSYSTSCKS